MVLFTGSLFSDNIFVRGQGGMKMDEIWKKAVIAAMEKKGYTREQLAAEMEISVKELNRILSGDCRISLEQLSEFRISLSPQSKYFICVPGGKSAEHPHR